MTNLPMGFLLAIVGSATSLQWVLALAMLGGAACADHAHMLIHEPPRRRAVAGGDDVRERAMRCEDACRHLGRERAVVARPGDVLERDELEHEHAIVRRLRERQVEIAAQAGEGVKIVPLAL